MTSSSRTPLLLHQPPTVAAAVKVSSVAILHFLLCCLVSELRKELCQTGSSGTHMVSGHTFIMQENDQDFFPVAMVPAHLRV